MSAIPKAVLYYSPHSVWSAAVLLALHEKGYGSDELDLKPVDLSKGENYDVTYLRINPKATVPTLVVPLEKTLSEDIESRYKAVTDSKTIVQFLDKSRSALSRTHTTSPAPAPALTPATVAFTNTCNTVIDVVRSDAADPNKLRLMNAHDDVSFQELAKEVLPGILSTCQTLEKYLEDAQSGRIHVSEKVIKLWQDKKSTLDSLHTVLADGDVPESKLTTDGKVERAKFLENAAKAWETDLKEIVTKINKEIIGPFVLGDQFSIADVHLAAWLTRVLKLSGVTVSDDGESAIKKLEKRMKAEKLLPRNSKSGENGETKGEEEETKLGCFWEEIEKRGSWRWVYGNGLY
ncbi:hypothetical protein AMATHDRAFT_52046 [Amanita thiersii Skay4041]|uniref:GST N-terminal domain-containing protein n=1 Tax=Amanita thiersii Skay4041 TaxID=703135 RepID=A0A2A9P1A0_9AGAR|nr:hypothetical protein AMATHDRAFT_52046 [Amanita thiersii Skay4041]